MNQEPAIQGQAPIVMVQPYDIGFVVERMLSKLPPEIQRAMGDALAQPGVEMIHKMIISELQHMFFELSGQYNLSPEMFERVRVQTTAAASILATLNQKGREAKEAASAGGPQKGPAEVETPIVTE